MKHAIAIDFGSTFTKEVIVDLEEKKVLLTYMVPSTVGTNAGIGLSQCFQKAKQLLGEKDFEQSLKLSTSSAAGGLRMTVVGLTKSLSTLAGESAALGAGAKIVANLTGLLTKEKIRELEESSSEIVLFTGGYEKGNCTLVIRNAEMLAKSDIRVPVIYAGNSQLDKDVRLILESRGKSCFIVENIIPHLGELNVSPTQDVIRDLFLDRITNMKGFGEVKKEFDAPIVPTPVAVLRAGELLSQGPGGCGGLGPLLIVDIGGATTDVYSFNENRGYEGARIVGLEEAYAKRTVEGDLGMRESSGGAVSDENVANASRRLGIGEEDVRKSIRKRIENHDYLPDSEVERQLDNEIANYAVFKAVRRHAGHLETSYDKKGLDLQIGKNISEVSKIIGTGGVLIHNEDPASVLKWACREKDNTADQRRLLPDSLDTFLDTEYVLFAAGLLRQVDEHVAYAIMKDSIRGC